MRRRVDRARRFHPGDVMAGEVIVCAGPPQCLLQGDEAVKNQEEGCPLCRRIVVHDDGTETEYQMKAN